MRWEGNINVDRKESVSVWLWLGSSGGFCARGNKTSGSIKGGPYFDHLFVGVANC